MYICVINHVDKVFKPKAGRIIMQLSSQNLFFNLLNLSIQNRWSIYCFLKGSSELKRRFGFEISHALSFHRAVIQYNCNMRRDSPVR